MIIDKLTEFSNKQAVTTSADAATVLDLSVDHRGEGHPITVLCQVTTDFVATGAATLTVVMSDSDDDSSFTAVTTTAAIAVASLVAGYQFKLGPLPDSLRRYLKLAYTVATGPMTAGNIQAGLVLNTQTNKSREA